MKVWIVWEIVSDYPEAGGGDYVNEIFANKDDAEKYCDEQNRKNEYANTIFQVESWEVK